MKKTFDESWEDEIYSKGKQLNLYPYDILVSLIARRYFGIPKDERKEIKILDLGCGGGNNSMFLAENGFDVYGIDGSESAIECCKKRFVERGLTGTFDVADFSELPFEDGFFDCAVDRESVYANNYSDIENTINQVYDKLKPGGIFISFMYNTGHTGMKYGEEVEKNTYTNFSEGPFKETKKAHFVDRDEVEKELFNKFEIKSIIEHSMKEIYDEDKKDMEVAEYIIVAEK